MGLGTGSNNFAELINWFNGVQQCQNYSLITFLEDILHLKRIFDHIIVCHIYRECNSDAKFLSKEGLQ